MNYDSLLVHKFRILKLTPNSPWSFLLQCWFHRETIWCRHIFITVILWERYYFLRDCRFYCCSTWKVLDILPEGNLNSVTTGWFEDMFRGTRQDKYRDRFQGNLLRGTRQGRGRDRVQGNLLLGRIAYPLFLRYCSRRWISEEQQKPGECRSWAQSGSVLCSEINQVYT